jgi:DNA topoisomerase-1
MEEDCPLCGAELVLKYGKYGAFYGCVRFPKCKGSRNIESVEEQTGIASFDTGEFYK